jgi:hypothetical protein
MKYVLFYESAPDVASKAQAHFPAHKARYQDFLVGLASAPLPDHRRHRRSRRDGGLDGGHRDRLRA